MARPGTILIAGPTASGKSALALARGRTARRHRHQRRFHAGLSRSAHHHGAAERRRRRRACRTGSMAMSMRRRTIRSGAGARMPARRWTRPRRAGRVPILVGGTGLYFKALTQGLSAVPPTPPEIRAAVRGALRRRGRRGAACRARPPRSGDGRAAQARRPHADRPRARSAGGDRPLARRLAPRRHAGDPRPGRRR